MASVARLSGAAARRLPLARSTTARSLGTKPREDINTEPLPPNYTIDSIKPPKYWSAPPPQEPDPNTPVRKAVTSAHAIDLTSDPPKLSARDSAALSPNGTVVHGRYGELGPDVAQGIPLEYLALLRPAAEGAAGLRVTLENAKKLGLTDGSSGTVLVYGATQPSGMAAVQLASASGKAAVAVVGGEHSGNHEMVDVVKGMATEPGTAVAEEYALVKASFRDLVDKTANGDDPASWTNHDAEALLSDFKANLLDYVAAYPDTLPAAVSKDKLLFAGKEKDRKSFRANMDAYLSQFPPGEAPIDPAQLETYFSKEQYAVWKAKFGRQTTAVISGDDTGDFVPARIVREQMASPDPVPESMLKPAEVPYEFDVLRRNFGTGDSVKPTPGGPVLGAVIAVTPDLQSAAEAVADAGPTLRAKAEALQFLKASERNAYAAACSVASLARSAGGTVSVVGGSLPGLESAEPTDADVQEALSAMVIEEDGTSRLNYFVQVYRAGDHPVYADYAVHRATEELAGPRVVVVTK